MANNLRHSKRERFLFCAFLLLHLFNLAFALATRIIQILA
jgi:hypothetical protein